MNYNQKKIIAYLSADRKDVARTYFDLPWVKKAHRLLMLLLSVRSRDAEEEWQDFVNLFEAGKKSDLLPDYRWPTQKSVLRDWRIFRDMMRELANARRPIDWWGIGKRYPAELLAKAERLPRETWDREIFHPLDPFDVMLVAWTYGHVNEIDYRKCAAEGCEHYAARPFPKKTGRPLLYCADCNASKRDLERHNVKNRKTDRRAWEIVRRALERTPAEKRSVAGDEDRRRLANRLFKMVKKDLAKIPGKRGARWIAKKLRGDNNG